MSLLFLPIGGTLSASYFFNFPATAFLFIFITLSSLASVAWFLNVNEPLFFPDRNNFFADRCVLKKRGRLLFWKWFEVGAVISAADGSFSFMGRGRGKCIIHVVGHGGYAIRSGCLSTICLSYLPKCISIDLSMPPFLPKSIFQMPTPGSWSTSVVK